MFRPNKKALYFALMAIYQQSMPSSDNPGKDVNYTAKHDYGRLRIFKMPENLS